MCGAMIFVWTRPANDVPATDVPATDVPTSTDRDGPPPTGHTSNRPFDDAAASGGVRVRQ